MCFLNIYFTFIIEPLGSDDVSRGKQEMALLMFADLMDHSNLCIKYADSIYTNPYFDFYLLLFISYDRFLFNFGQL